MYDWVSLATSGLVSPPILFFVLGMVAVLVRSNLVVPKELTAVPALYLMMSIGFKGGAELARSGMTIHFLGAAAGGLVIGLIMPVVAFVLLSRSRRVAAVDAASVAAHYGSVSVVTFLAAQAFLSHLSIPTSGHMVAVMALMEAPGILVGLLLAHLALKKRPGEAATQVFLGTAMREVLVGGSVMLLLGSFVIGALTGEQGMGALRPVVEDLFPGALALFLLDMGTTAARHFRHFAGLGWCFAGFGVALPLIGAALAAAISVTARLGAGDAVLLMALAASASYIAAPAAVRLALPQANASIPITLAVGITFPFNIVIGIPLYYLAASSLSPA